MIALRGSCGLERRQRPPAVPGHAGGARALYIAECDGYLVGTITVEWFADDRQLADGHSLAHISNLVVHHRYRRRGIGRALMGAVERAAPPRGCLAMTIGVDDGTTTPGASTSAGGTSTSRTSTPPGADPHPQPTLALASWWCPGWAAGVGRRKCSRTRARPAPAGHSRSASTIPRTQPRPPPLSTKRALVARPGSPASPRPPPSGWHSPPAPAPHQPGPQPPAGAPRPPARTARPPPAPGRRGRRGRAPPAPPPCASPPGASAPPARCCARRCSGSTPASPRTRPRR